MEHLFVVDTLSGAEDEAVSKKLSLTHEGREVIKITINCLFYGQL